jgi:hypothetical protein
MGAILCQSFSNQGSSLPGSRPWDPVVPVTEDRVKANCGGTKQSRDGSTVGRNKTLREGITGLLGSSERCTGNMCP